MKNHRNNTVKSKLTSADVLRLSNTELLHCIASEQVSGRSDIPNGFFEAYRYYPFGYHRVENTLFNTAITLFQLQQLLPLSDNDEQKLIQSICQKAIESFPLYLSRTGKPRYNFWQTRPDRHFPNGKLLGRFARFRPADDADDTVMVYLTSPHSEAQTIWLRNELNAYANGVKKWSKSMPHGMDKLPVYATFFVDKMDVSADICVLCNVLYWVYSNGFTLNVHDHASLDFIADCIEQNLHFSRPVSISRYYPHTAVIIYHVVRLINRFKPQRLQPLIHKLIRDLMHLEGMQLSFMHKIIIHSSLFKLGKQPKKQLIPSADSADFASGFTYFAYPVTVEYKNPMLYKLSTISATHMRFYCKAFFLSLVLEYKHLQQQI